MKQYRKFEPYFVEATGFTRTGGRLRLRLRGDGYHPEDVMRGSCAPDWWLIEVAATGPMNTPTTDEEKRAAEAQLVADGLAEWMEFDGRFLIATQELLDLLASAA